MTKKQTFSQLAVLVLLASLLVVPTVHAQQATRLAKQFSSSLAQRRGLCVYLGGTDTTIPLLLSAGGNHIVNILTPDSDAVASMRAEISEQRLLGVVTAEQVSLGHLPHSSNLVNLVVVDQLGSHHQF